jgi:hypothetical protein
MAYDSAPLDHVKYQKDPNKKARLIIIYFHWAFQSVPIFPFFAILQAGQYKLSDEDRREIEFVYNTMKETDMWKLSTGKCVKKELYILGKELEFEQ